MNENHWQKLSAIIKVGEVFIFLYKDLIVKNNFNFVVTFQNVVAFFFSECPVGNKAVTVFEKR